MRLDLTFNIPTILSLILLTVSATATGFGLYYGLEKRQAASEFAASELARRIEKNEAAVSSLKTDAAANNSVLRAEMKADITEIKDLLNRLIFAPNNLPSQMPQPQPNMTPYQRQQLQQWSK